MLVIQMELIMNKANRMETLIIIMYRIITKEGIVVVIMGKYLGTAHTIVQILSLTDNYH